MKLIERDDVLQQLADAHSAACAGDGRLVLVAGEAGIGKTSVLRSFAGSVVGSGPAAWGWCDPLSAPRPFAPFLEVLQTLRYPGPLEGMKSARDLLSALLQEVRGARCRVLIFIEDAHWADDASLEVLRLVGRRVHLLPALMVVSFRDDEVGAMHPLKRALGSLATAPAISRIILPPLSADGIRRLAADAPVDVTTIHRQSGGNPFFATELLASERAGRGSDAIGDLVLERMARLTAEAREFLEAAAVLGHAKGSVLRRVSGNAAEAAEHCIAVGLLRASAAGAVFRHELVRDVVLETIGPMRRIELHAQVLRVLMEAGERDAAELAHHAEGACDATVAQSCAAVAARHAASVGSHREAAFQFARALRFTPNTPSEERAILVRELAQECAALDRLDEAVAGFEEAAAIWRTLGRCREEATCLSATALPLVGSGRNAEADDRCRQAIGMLEEDGPSYELAYALRTQSHLRMLDRDKDQALLFGWRAIRMASALGDRATLAAAHLSVGSALLVADDADGRAHLDSALRLAREDCRDEIVAHGYLNIGSSYGEQFHLALSERYLREGAAFAAERDLDQHLHYMQAWLALTLTYRGRLEEAEATALGLLATEAVAPVSRIMALAALGRLRARRGAPGAQEALDEALDLALPTGTLQRIAPVRLARAEMAALAGDLALARREADCVLQLAVAHRHKWHVGEVAYWQSRCGTACDVPPWCARPFALQIQGRWREAAEAWRTLGCPYEEARALAEGDEAEQMAALATFEAMRARPAAAALRARMRRAGIRSLPRGPRPATRANILGLTERQSEIVALVAEGLTNREIARRLEISTKTVDHHVSASLAKLGVSDRREVGAIIRTFRREPQYRERKAFT